jgi:hypothetical protein
MMVLPMSKIRWIICWTWLNFIHFWSGSFTLFSILGGICDLKCLTPVPISQCKEREREREREICNYIIFLVSLWQAENWLFMSATFSWKFVAKWGHNNRGVITSWHRGGGHNHLYRQIDIQWHYLTDLSGPCQWFLYRYLRLMSTQIKWNLQCWKIWENSFDMSESLKKNPSFSLIIIFQ